MPTLESRSSRPGSARRRFGSARATLDAAEHLVGGLGTAVLALVMLLAVLATAILAVIGVGLLIAPRLLRALRVVADRERARLSRWGPEVIGAPPVPSGLRAALADSTTRRELGWVAAHATGGLALGLIGVTIPLYAVRDVSFPLWWRLVPPPDATASLWFWTVHDWPGAVGVAFLGLGWLAVTVLLLPTLARAQAGPGRRLLAPDPDTDLALRVAQLTATRAGALDAHAAELRRIERALHDGTQNPMVTVTILLGAARRALARDPAAVDPILEQAQASAEQALGELRAVVRSILPPVLADRSLADALTGLAAACPVPCRIDAPVAERCAASVEATAYFVVAEALTNVARHSHAHKATVSVHRRGPRLLVEVTDDGRGGADEGAGSGLMGIRRRVEAHDGTFNLSSPPGGPTTLEVSLPCGS
jgi:signal transduction histidine kinase